MDNKRDALIVFRGNRSQAEMAKLYGVTQQSWSLWERGKNTPSPALMKKLEVDIGIPMEDIFFDVFNIKPLQSES